MTEQSASVNGHHNIIVQAMGDNIRVNTDVQCLTLLPWGRWVRPVKRDTDILDPACEAVPLVGREDDQAFLREWLTGGGIGIATVVGRGGSGKTRLALDLLQHVPEGWDGGWLRVAEAQRYFKERNLSGWSWRCPTLIVVDYAAMLGETLKQWLAELADHDAKDDANASALRILLLERHADEKTGWYHDLADDTRSGQRAQELLRPRQPRHIAPLDAVEYRRAVLSAGMQRASAIGGRPSQQLPARGLSPAFDAKLAQPQWRDPLLLLMAAVSGIDGSVHQALALSRRELATSLARRERDRLRASAKDAKTGPLLVHLYACITLCGGLDRETAVRLAEMELAALHKSYPGGAGQAIDDLGERLGAGETLPGMTPDLLAEAFLLEVFGERSGLGEQVIERLAPLASARMAAVLIRLVQDFGHVDASKKTDPQVVAWAELALHWIQALVHAGESDYGVLVDVESALPEYTLTLRGIAVEVTGALVDRLRQVEYANTEDGQVLLARWLNGLAIRQSNMGLREAALHSIEEAVALRRELAERNPEAFLPVLAMSLNNLSNHQSNVGQREAALHSIQEAVASRRELAERNPEAFMPDLAMSLNNLSSCQSDVGRREAALESIQEAVALRRELAELNPEAFLPNLAMSLNNMSGCQSDVGRREAALESIQEAVVILRELAERNLEAFMPDLAMSLNNISNRQSDVGLREAALESIEEAVALRRELAERNPEAFMPDLAASLNNLSNQQSDVGRREAALESIQEAVVILRELAERNSEAFLPSLAMSLNNMSNQQSNVGQREAALESIQEAIAIRRDLAERNQEAFLPNLAGSLNNLSNRQSDVGQREAALESIEEAVGHCRELAERNQEAFLPNLAMSREAALESIEEAVSHYRELAERNPEAFLPNLATSVSVLGNRLAEMERVPEAQEAAAEALALLAPMFQRYPEVFEGLAQVTLRDYVQRSEQLGLDPAWDVVAPYRSLFEVPEEGEQQTGESHD